MYNLIYQIIHSYIYRATTPNAFYVDAYMHIDLRRKNPAILTTQCINILPYN